MRTLVERGGLGRSICIALIRTGTPGLAQFSPASELGFVGAIHVSCQSVMSENPYEQLNATDTESHHNCVFMWLKLILWQVSMLLAFFGLGAVFGLVASVLAGFAFVPEPSSGLSYGQQFAFITVPACTLLGAAIGFSLGLAYFKQRIIAAVSLIATSSIGWLVTSSQWDSQLRNYGPDQSEVVLYYPPTGMCILSVCVAVWILIHRAVNRRRGTETEHSHATER